MTPLLLVLALVGASPRPSDAALWEAAFALGDPDAAPRAEALLTKAGPAGLDVLLKMARAGGEPAALNAAMLESRCPVGLAGDSLQNQMMMRARKLEPSQLAARFVSTRMKADPPLLQRLLSSRSSFERRLALAHLASDPQALLAALERLDREDDPQVLTLAQRALQCAIYPPFKGPVDFKAIQSAQARLGKRLERQVPQKNCDSAEGITGEMREGLLQGSWKIHGWGASGNTVTVTVDTGRDVRLQLTPPCALALYDTLAQRDVYLQGLVMPLSTYEGLPRDVRRDAARRATRDLERYPEQERNRLAAELVNAGHSVSRAIVLRENDFMLGETELEAAARQRQPGAAEAIDTYVFCRGAFNDATVALLGFVGTPQAAETALRFATHCPRARRAATAALLRLKDPRALEQLGPALAETSSDHHLSRAAAEAYTPALGEKLRALKDTGGSDAKVSREAASLLKSLKAAGLPVP